MVGVAEGSGRKGVSHPARLLQGYLGSGRPPSGGGMPEARTRQWLRIG